MVAKVLTSIVFVVACPVAMAQTTCATLSDAVELQLKKAASNFADGITDNSAPRATLRELRTSNSLALAHINIDLMAQNKCAPRTKPADPMIYLGEALDCELARQKGESDPLSCKMDEWKGLKASSPANGSEG